MDTRTEVRDFLMSRRARLRPAEVDLPVHSGQRRVEGLRREEVALLAGVSVDYYTRLERGDLGGASESVLDALAAALRLTEAEHAHLYDLARAARSSGARRLRPPALRVRPAVQQLLDAITAPAWVRSPRADFLAGNPLARALYAPLFVDPRRPANTARFTFLDPRAADFYPDWDRMADSSVASLRAAAGRTPLDKGLTDLIGELSTRSEAFRRRWASHDVMVHRTGGKRIRHPEVGLLEVTFEAMELVADPGLTLFAYGTAPGSASEQALRLLGSLARTEQGVPVRD